MEKLFIEFKKSALEMFSTKSHSAFRFTFGSCPMKMINFEEILEYTA